MKIPHDGSGPGIAFAKIDDLGEVTAKLVQEYLDSDELEPLLEREPEGLKETLKKMANGQTISLLVF
ncbi:MAG: hypothetical protein ALECFALPRED_004288 [Alectoria fallacina]|uniref:Uncharacterized protein n=1 Tax=Alectoria fallacina TaxID=1903189 RepID=A0A8H3IW55_9LECA|nr:MAG: hypothetical protein ALECFALPRED_004288 [Alectoria fallacina]